MKKKNKKVKEHKLELGLPNLLPGEGGEILKQTTEMSIVLPMNAFYLTWELLEAGVKKTNGRYDKGPLAHVGAALDLATKEFRSAFYRTTTGQVFKTRAELEEQERQARKDKERPKGKDRKKDPAKIESILCGAKHTDDKGKTRKCRREPAHKGKHKDKKGNKW